MLTRRTFLAATALAVVLPAVPALGAGKLDELRTSGAVGERYDGFLVVRDGGGDAKAAVKKINGQRRKIYEKRAKEAGVSVEQIGQVYAQEIMEDAPNGTYFLTQDGKWSKK